MKKILIVLFSFLIVTTSLQAKNVSGISIQDTYDFGNKTLVLNGTGYRKKFFIKIYIGALYVEKKTSNFEEVLNQNPKVIKMHFLYKKVKAGQMQKAFKEGFEKASPNLVNSDSVAKFLNVFNFDVVRGDEIDLILDNDNVIVTHNNKKIAEIKSKELAEAILKIYIGERPADKNLKKGLLGV
ncbi:chalcone isomerase family protein [Deferribacter abyssi]|uniref:chalcone isomerase family protein n=1 Tax=Deferribacter abyssi TaxID=213806 RepID=UPI003C16031E